MLNGWSQQSRRGYGDKQVETVASTRKERGIRLSHRNEADDDVDIEHDSYHASCHNYRLIILRVRQVLQDEGSNDEGNPKVFQLVDPLSPSYRSCVCLYSWLAFSRFRERETCSAQEAHQDRDALTLSLRSHSCLRFLWLESSQ